MNGIKGIQDPALRNLIEGLFVDYGRLEQRVSDLERLRQPPAHYLFKPFGEEPVEVDTLIWTVPKDVDGLRLEVAEAALVNSGGSNTQVSVNNLTQAVSILYANLFINSGDVHSDDSGPEVEIDHTANQVFWRDKIEISVISAGSGATGLGVTLGFVRA